MTHIRVLVCGGRDFYDVEAVHRGLNALSALSPIAVVIHGAASGADSIAAGWARHKNIPAQAFPANWKKYGRAAGPLRNKLMLEEGRPDVVLAFPGGAGTANMISLATKAGVRVIEVPVFTDA